MKRIILPIALVLFAFGATFAVLYLVFPESEVVAVEPVVAFANAAPTSPPPMPPQTEAPEEPQTIADFLHNNPFPEGFTANNAALPWQLILVNRYNFLNADFAPPLAHIAAWHYFDSRAIQNLRDMLEYAEDEGLRPIVRSAHRGIATQRTLFDNQVQRNVSIGLDADEAFEAARRVVAYPGSSEHNLGLGIDIVSYFYQNLTAHFGQTEEGRWLAQNAHRFGFVLRYPYHQQHITNIIYEPWHFRYVGIDHAAAMFENDVVLEQYVFWLQSQ